MKTRAQVVTGLLVSGVDDLDELHARAEVELGQTLSRKVLRDYRSRFKRLGPDWASLVSAQNAETHRAASLRWKTANIARKLLHQCRASARYRRHECTITEELLTELLHGMTCSVTGLPLSLEWKGPSGSNPWAPSVDRLDNSRGYVPGNVRMVCWAFNNMRGDFPDEVVETLIRACASRLSAS